MVRMFDTSKTCASATALLSRSGKLSRLSLFLLAVTSATLSNFVAAQEIIRVGGTGTGTLLIQRMGESYAKLKPGIKVVPVMPPMGSNGSLRALAAGSIQIAIVTFPSVYPPKPEETQANNSIPWVRTPLVFTGHAVAGGTKMTLTQIADIYSGLVVQWLDGKPIRLITRTERESDTRILRAISTKMEAAVVTMAGRAGMPFAENDIDNQQMLERTAGSFGAIALGQLLLTGSPLTPVTLDGIKPSPENLQNGSYRIEKPLYLVTNKASSVAALEFIRYLQSPGVMNTIRRYGFIPMQQN